jgi:8-oxo-dGTP pyrophosphatase MutT (NUDIX family)
MSSIKPWKIVSSQTVFDNPWCQVRQDEVQLPKGEVIGDFYVNVRPDIVVILPITPQKEIVFVRQYRHAVGQILLELPAGTFNPKTEDKQIAAARELEEETGYIAPQLIQLAKVYDNPVKDTNEIYLFLAENVQPASTQQLDATEDIEVVVLPIEEALAKISTNEICVSGTIAALFIGLRFLSEVPSPSPFRNSK